MRVTLKTKTKNFFDHDWKQVEKKVNKKRKATKVMLNAGAAKKMWIDESNLKMLKNNNIEGNRLWTLLSLLKVWSAQNVM